jgi:protein-S-isoprenylcysteine O-methyltransferase Ste14
MNAILDELGYPRGPRPKLYLVAIFAATTLVFLAIGHLLTSTLNMHAVMFHVLVWAGWFTWQGYFFARNRERYLRADPAHAYRVAFRHDILPGVALGVSQMLRPSWNAILISLHFNDSPWLLLLSTACITIGAGLLYLGFRTIGFDGAGFLYEYKPHTAPLTHQSIYAVMRHPLFTGGVFVSVGIGLVLGESTTLAMVAINVLILPVYAYLEDVRLIRVFGLPYRDYKLQVGGLIPRLGILKKHAAADRAHPNWGRKESK